MKLGKYFKHNRSERNGSIALLIIGTLSLIVGEMYYRTRAPHHNSSTLYQQIDSLRLVSDPPVSPVEFEARLFSFDPNTLSDSGYTSLGFSAKEIATLRKYQASGGVFRRKSDFGKLYFIDSTEYILLEPYIEINSPSSNVKAQKAYPKWEKKTQIKWSDTAATKEFNYSKKLVDLNTADSIQLVGIYGVGGFTAKSILRRRKELGGFYDVGQLMEIPKMTIERIDQIAPNVEIDLSQIKKLAINKVTARELGQHPYCPMSMANAVIMERERNGKYRDIADFCQRNLVDPSLCGKLAPYLAFI